MDERRLLEEGNLLELRFPNVRVGMDRDAGTGWCFIPAFDLPKGWNKRTSNLLIIVPAGYPHIPPDSFFLEQGLRDTSGRPVKSYFEEQVGPNPYHDRGWAWFCYHIQRDSWHPAFHPLEGDTLLTYADLVYQVLAAAPAR